MFNDVVGSTRRASERARSRLGAGGCCSTSAAIHAVRDIARELTRVDLPIHVGIHAGQIDRCGGVSGIALDIAARITGDEVFTPVGEGELKGLEGPWFLYEAS